MAKTFYRVSEVSYTPWDKEDGNEKNFENREDAESFYNQLKDQYKNNSLRVIHEHNAANWKKFEVKPINDPTGEGWIYYVCFQELTLHTENNGMWR